MTTQRIITAATDRKNIRQTLTRRSNARRLPAPGGALCPICGNAAAQPYVRRVDGVISEGCVDATHAEHASSRARAGGYFDWFHSQSARRCRAGLNKY